MIRTFARTLIDYGANFNPEYRRLRCMGHILNLSIKAFLFGDMGTSGMQEQLDVIIVMDKTMALWRKLSPWGKARNITVYIRSSVQRKQQRKRLDAETLLQAGNAIRWNSGLSMIQSLLWNKEAVNSFCLNHPDLAQHTLSESDWVELESAVGIIQPFLRSTLHLESKKPNLWEIIPEIDYLSSVYRDDHIPSSYFLFLKLHVLFLFIYIGVDNSVNTYANVITSDGIGKYSPEAHLA